GSVDYYSFDFSDPIIVEEQSSIVGAAIAALGTASTDDDGILSRITFTDGDNDGPEASEISRIATNVVNGPDIETSGVDLRLQHVSEMDGNELTLGLDATYIMEYVVGDSDIEGVTIAGSDRVGQFNRSNFSRSMPQWKANLTANYAVGAHNFRGVLRHIDSYDDERAGGIADTIDSQTTFDLFYNWSSEEMGVDLGLGVVNVTDEDPPFAAFDLNYDPYTHNPFGRTFKISLSKSFGG
ncbi:MAG: TonB-dependent receptor, partial [Henriciella sp.]